MKVGVPKEIKTHEYRVGLIPAAVRLASDVDGTFAVVDELTSGPAEQASGQAAEHHA